MTDRVTHARSDVLDNRERILDAARAVFATEGLTAPVREVARRAGVAPATLYRHYPSKGALVTEAFAEQMSACRTIVDAGVADPDPWRGLCHVVEEICALHARDRGFTTAVMSAFPDARDFAADRHDTLASVADLARRAKDDGHLHPDFTMDDLVLILRANNGIRATPATAVPASRRFAALAIRALRATPAPHPGPIRQKG